MSFDSHALSPGCGANAMRTGVSGEPLQVDHELQRALYVAIEQLGMLLRVRHDPRQSAQLRAEITAGAQWIDFLFDQREDIAISANERKPDLFKLGGRVVCESCREEAKANSGRTGGHSDSAPLPIWKTQVEFLVACTKRVGVELFEHDCASYNLRKFPECLAQLANALLRLRRCLPSGAGEPRIEVKHCSDS